MGDSKRKTRHQKRAAEAELKTALEQLIQDHHLNFCLECGKCSSLCPMPDVYGEYAYDRSPRGVVERLLLGLEEMDDEGFWYCLTCQECTSYCPCGVDFQDFMMRFRELLLEHGHRKHAVFCSGCGVYLLPKKEVEYLIKDPDKKKTRELLSMCPRCKTKQYTQVLRRSAFFPKNLKTG